MSTVQPPVPYDEFLTEQQARIHAEQERDQWRSLYTQEQQAHEQQRTQFEQRYECQLETLLDGSATMKTVPFSVYQKLLQRFKLLKEGPYKPTERLMIDELQYQLEHPQKVDPDGYARINYQTAARHINMSSSTPKRSIQAIIEQTPAYPLQCKWDVPEITQDGKKIECLYAKATVPNLVATSITLELKHKRKQGGNQYECQKCHSINVMIERRLTCLDCGHTSLLEPTYPNGKKNNSGKRGKSNLLLTDMPDHTANTANSNETAPPENFLTDDAQPVGMVITSDPPLDADKLFDEGNILSEAESRDITSAAELLLAIAGEHDTHIVMPRTHASKYLEVKRPLAFFDLVDHLKAGEARGALCRYQDGSTRGLCFDTDEEDEWEAWGRASRKLVQAGYIVIFEESPAGRGGHLWIIFDELVDAAAARVAVLQVAPELADCAEYWPGPQEAMSWNRVRLPGGFYARYGRHVERPVKAWCTLVNVATGESSSDGRSAARLLLSSLTPAAIVKAEPVITAEPVLEIHTQDEQLQVEAVGSEDTVPFTTQDEQTEAPIVESVAAAPLSNSETHDQAAGIASAAAAPLPLPNVDAQWERRYGKVENTTCWFAIMPEVAARWFNERHRLEEIRPRETNGMALSPHGNERTASTNYRDTPDGERYTDHSMHGRRSDGTRESGDALELAAKVEGTSKSAFLSRVIREMIREGKAALESAAAAGQPLPGWFEEPDCILTPTGRRKYVELLAESEARKPSVPPAPVTVVEPAPTAPVETEFPTPAAVTKRMEESMMKLEGPGQGETPTEIEPEYDASIPLSPDQDEPDAPACLVEEHKTDLVEGMRVDTPAGLATIRFIRHCPRLKRLRCAVRTDHVQPNGLRFAAFDVSEIQPIEQGKLL